MTGKILRLGRRQLHTIISREIIKPSSPTPSHLRTYNLSQLDQYAPHSYVPLIFFYPNNSSLTADDKARKLKNSLSQSLTRYYPFAGTLRTPTTPYINCNDEGVIFVEAKNDSEMTKFQSISEEEDDTVVDEINKLFSDGMVWQNHNSPHRTGLLGVQLNHFACGGTAVAVSLSHKVGDGCTLGAYVSHWASVARYGSIDHEHVRTLSPHFIQSQTSVINSPHPHVINPKCVNHVTRKFMFPNSKIRDLKNKVIAMAEPGSTLSVNNLTRVEVLTSLLYKAIVEAKSGSFKPSFLVISVDVRNKFVPKLPRTTVGNILGVMMVTTRNEIEASLSLVVSEIKKEKMALDHRVQTMQQALEDIESFMSRLGSEDQVNVANGSIWCSSLCGFAYNEVDFGWGKPKEADVILGSSGRTGFMLMDTPDGDGIQARVTLEKRHMDILKNDKELLSYCQS